jgi:hypothetical protein
LRRKAKINEKNKVEILNKEIAKYNRVKEILKKEHSDDYQLAMIDHYIEEIKEDQAKLVLEAL